ncbi:MAG: hypothetical protein AAGB29_03255 [Planctomycetota bacterium]
MTLAQAAQQAADQAAEPPPYIWLLLLGIVLVIAYLFISIRAKRRRSATDPSLSATEQIERNRQLKGMRGDLETIMVEIEQMAKRVGHQLDAKATRLEQLINEAELKIAQLDRAQNGHDSPADDSPPASASSNDATPAPASDESQDDDRRRRIYALADAGHDAHEIALELNEMPGTVELILNLRQP